MRENGSVLAAAVVLGKLLSTLASVAPHATLATSDATGSGSSPLAELVFNDVACQLEQAEELVASCGRGGIGEECGG